MVKKENKRNKRVRKGRIYIYIYIYIYIERERGLKRAKK